jgi:hypothetical protein
MITHMMWLFNVERSPGDTSVIDPFAETGSKSRSVPRMRVALIRC